MRAFFVQQKFDHRRAGNHTELAGIELFGFTQNFSQDVINHRSGGFDHAFATARRTRLTQHVRQGLTGALARHLQQAQLRKTTGHGFDPVSGQLLFELR